MKLVCGICKYEIATFTTDVRVPLIGAMFTSKDDFHGVPAPWSPVTPWEHMYCPMCQKRAFEPPDEHGNHIVLTDEGERCITNEGVFIRPEEVEPTVPDVDATVPPHADAPSGTDGGDVEPVETAPELKPEETEPVKPVVKSAKPAKKG